jgi:DNA-binding response OmpR family regulator
MEKPRVSPSLSLARDTSSAAIEDASAYAPHILIVENNLSYAFGLMATLKGWRPFGAKSNCTVDLAPDIDQAKKFLSLNEVDIFILDLVMHETIGDSEERKEIGQSFAKEVRDTTDAGIIVLTSLSEDDADTSWLFREVGIDDYIRKAISDATTVIDQGNFVRQGQTDGERVLDRVVALRRRMLPTRPGKEQFAHYGRVFKVGPWKFVAGSRCLTSDNGETIRLSHTEHAFLCHICVSENYECDKISFNTFGMKRKSSEREMRIDNLVYRLRQKLGDNLHLISDEGSYRLLNVRELTPL